MTNEGEYEESKNEEGTFDENLLNSGEKYSSKKLF
jgi:hypothetical protein